VNVILISNMPWQHDGETNRQAWATALLEVDPGCEVTYVTVIGWNLVPKRSRVVLHAPGGTVRVLPGWNPFPWSGRPTSRFRRKINLWLTCMTLRLRTRIHSGSSESDLVTIFDPLAADVVNWLPARRYIYDCLDFYAEQPQYHAPRQRAVLDVAEARLAHAVDDVWVTTSRLAEHLANIGVTARHANGAVNRPSWASDKTTQRSVKASALPLRAIYVGALDTYKVDSTVFWRLVDLAPDIALTIIGHFEYDDEIAHTDYRSLAAHPNVHLNGSISRQELGLWLAEADFGLVAMAPGVYSDGSFPLKYWDYQWANIPTLAVGCQALEGQPGVITCKSAMDIDESVIKAVADMSPSDDRYKRHAAANDAVARIRKILSS
jgi:hypothetical protein